MTGADIKELVGEFLSIMGHNVITSTMIGRNTDLQESQDLNNIVEEDDDINTSNWQLLEEPPALEELDLGKNPYFERRVGISKNQQERLNLKAGQWWRCAMCPSCKRGFTARSVKKQCHKCDKFTHAKSNVLQWQRMIQFSYAKHAQTIQMINKLDRRMLEFCLARNATSNLNLSII